MNATKETLYHHTITILGQLLKPVSHAVTHFAGSWNDSDLNCYGIDNFDSDSSFFYYSGFLNVFKTSIRTIFFEKSINMTSTPLFVCSSLNVIRAVGRSIKFFLRKKYEKVTIRKSPSYNLIWVLYIYLILLRLCKPSLFLKKTNKAI